MLIIVIHFSQVPHLRFKRIMLYSVTVIYRVPDNTNTSSIAVVGSAKSGHYLFLGSISIPSSSNPLPGKNLFENFPKNNSLVQWGPLSWKF